MDIKTAQRDSYFDNLKFVLIFLVVAGHILLPLDKTRFSNNIFHLIYAFHMPCFVFVSGYFSKNVCRNGHFNAKKLFQILWLYFIFKVLVHITEGLIAGHISGSIDFFRESGAPWYLLALALWYLTIPVIKELSPKSVIMGSVVFSLLTGYQNSLDDFLALDRTLAFAPFFYLGYFADGDNDKLSFSLRLSEKRALFLCLGILTAAFIFFFAYDLLMPYANIVYGIKYQRMGDALYPYGALIRMIWYLAASFLSLGLMAAVPKRKYFFTVIGSRTLQIYILHRLIRDLMQYYGFYSLVNVHSKLWILGLLALSLALTFLLGNPYITHGFDAVRSLPWYFCRQEKKHTARL